MTVSSIATFAIGLSRSQNTQPSNRASAVVNGLLDSSQPHTDAAAKPSEVVTSQGQSAQLRQASQQIAQASTFLASAQSGLSDIASQLAAMGDLASRAAQPETTDAQRSALNAQFQAGYQKISTTLNTTQLNGQPVLTGAATSSVTDNALSDHSVSDPLTEAVLFPAPKPNILSPSGAVISLQAVKVAGQLVAGQQQKITKLQDSVEFAASSVEVASQNHEAARASLSNQDITSLFSGAADGKGSAITASVAQTNHLPNSVLQLLGE